MIQSGARGGEPIRLLDARFPGQFFKRDFESPRDLDDRVQGNGLFAALDVADEVDAEIGLLGELFLGPMPGKPLPADRFS